MKTRTPKPDDWRKHIKESVPLSEVEGYLCLMQNAGRLRYHRNNSGALRNANGRPVAFGEPGSPDFYVWIQGGVHLQFEVKRPVGGTLSPAQKQWQADMGRLGFGYYVVTSGVEAQRLVEGALWANLHTRPSL